MSFDLESYIDVASRIKLLKELYPDASLQPLNLDQPYTIQSIGNKTYLVYAAACYRDPADMRPGIGVAWEEIPGKGFTAGSELMVAETSAWGRAIVAAIQTSTKKVSSRQEAEAAQTRTAPVAKPWTTPVETTVTFADAIGELQEKQLIGQTEEPSICKHGTMILRTGTSEKTGKDYYGYVCTERRGQQCTSDWFEQNREGLWVKKGAGGGN